MAKRNPTRSDIVATGAEQFRREGYVVLQGVFADRVDELARIGERMIDQFRNADTEDEVPGKKRYGPRVRSILHMNHPRWHRGRPQDLTAILNAVSDPQVTAMADALLEEPAIFQQANFYMNPEESWEGGWHRDGQYDIYDILDKEKQIAVMEADAVPAREVHMHIALWPSAAFEMVPGSHRRWETDEQYDIRMNDYFSDAMPGRMPVKLEAGDVGFVHVNSIHRGLYPSDVRRRTIFVTWGIASRPRTPNREDMMTLCGAVPTFQPWFNWPGYLEGVSPAAREVFERFIKLYQDSWKPEYAAELSEQLQPYFASGPSTRHGRKRHATQNE